MTEASHLKRKAVLVLGMHRSGTSALTGVIARLGAALPKTNRGATQFNLKGYGEAILVNQFNERLLTSTGSSWQDWEPFDPNWVGSPFARSYAEVLHKLIDGEFGEAPVFVLKDPRICRLAPFWLEQLNALKIESHIVLAIRNPLEVAASLEKRDGIPLRTSLLLWLRHVLDAEAATRNLPRGWVHYEDLLADWRGVVGKLGPKLGLDWLNRTSEIDQEIDEFLTGKLRHHTSSDDEVVVRADVHEWTKSVYSLLSSRQLLDDESRVNLGSLDAVRSSFDIACNAFRPLIATETRRRLSRDLTLLKLQNKKLTAKVVAAEEKLAEYRRVTLPIRRLASLPTAILRQVGFASPRSPRAEKVVQSSVSTRPVAADGNGGKWWPPVDVAERDTKSIIAQAKAFAFEAQIAVICHVYYLALWPELAEQIRQIPAAFDLYVTIVNQEGATDLHSKIVAQFPSAQIKIVANHGGDIVPFISLLNSGALDHYYLICKIHTKKSPHRDDGDQWPRKIFFGLLGSPENVADILRAFNAEPKLGLVIADRELYEGERGWKGNREQAARVVTGIGLNLDDYPPRFVLASMFWARGTALKPLRDLNLSPDSFEPECGALDGTMCHAIARLFSIFAMSSNHAIKERAKI